MIYGIGTDLIEINRIRQIHEKSTHFFHKYYSPEEIAFLSERKDSVPGIAMNFAGKEAVAKAFGTGFNHKISACEIAILRNEEGAPYVKLKGTTREYAMACNISKIHISLSDTTNRHGCALASAYVILETETNI